MNRLRLLAALVAGGLATGAYAGCEQPPLVVIPPAADLEGSEEAEARVHEATSDYFLGMQEYVNCIRAELESGGDEASELFKRILVQRNNLAVAEAEAVQRWYESRFPSAAESADGN